jgi:hypothetical protein
MDWHAQTQTDRSYGSTVTAMRDCLFYAIGFADSLCYEGPVDDRALTDRPVI